MKRLSLAFVILILTVTAGFAQPIDPQGIGLSGTRQLLDSLVQDGDSVYVLTSYETEEGWSAVGVGLDANALHQVRLHAYTQFVPTDTAVQSYSVNIDQASVIIDSLSQVKTIRFQFSLPPIVNPNVHSLQLELALYGRNADGDIQFSSHYTSQVAVGSIRSLNDPVDDLHATYLRFVDVRTYPPVIFNPTAGGVVAATFQFRYSQPEQALSGSLILSLRNEVTDSTTRIYLRDRAPGALKVVPLNATSLRNLTYMDSIQGPTALAHNSTYTFAISYQDLNTNPVATAMVAGVRVDRLTEQLSILSPEREATIPRFFDIRYSQPEQAADGSLILAFERLDAVEDRRILYLRDITPGLSKQITFDALALNNPTLVDSMSGSSILSNIADYRLAMVYRDTLGNTASGDSIEPIYTRLSTLFPTLYEPRIGTSRTDSLVPVLFQLPQFADTVWLTFMADSLSPVADSLSPHILRLNPDYNRDALHTFYLDGRNIGSNSPHVAENNHGAEDWLTSQCVYYVTLTYGDTLRNANVSVTNYGYVWPDDRTTIPATMTEPRTNVNENETFLVSFSLPEDPLPGSVNVRFGAIPEITDPAGVHSVYLRNIVRGTTVLYLNARNFSYSDLVDSVAGNGTEEENNQLVDGVRYFVRIHYQDYLSNPESSSNTAVLRYDNHTVPATILAPQTGDTLERINSPVRFQQPERAFPGTLQLIFTQTAGESVDYGSPHVLFVSNPAANADTGKVVYVQPLALYSSSGIDSTQGGSELLLNSMYSLTVQYQDTLGNPASVARVDSLFYTSGATVYVNGGEIGDGQVAPGATRSEAFWLGLRAIPTQSVLRKLVFHPFGSAVISDFLASQISLWQSEDSIFSEADDALVGRISTWNGGDLVFDSLAIEIDGFGTNVILTVAFSPTADAGHSVHFQVAGPSSIDCGMDPIIANTWPIGRPDVPLDVELTSYGTEQDTLFGALRVWWVVASERDNAGFILLRRAETDTVFMPVASYATSPELVGRGYDPTAARYQFTDRGLIPGQRYYYRITAVSFSFYEHELDALIEGIPRIPPQNFILGNAYPNPFNQDVTFSYVVPYTAEVEITVFDLLGRKVKTLAHRIHAPAEYHARWDSRTESGGLVPSGIYFYRMDAGGTFNETRKLILIR